MNEQLVFYNPKFEKSVREALNRPNGNITEDDALCATELNCEDYRFNDEDIETLCKFKKLESLEIELYDTDLTFLSNFNDLTSITISYYGKRGVFDFSVFECLNNLECLHLNGSYFSTMELVNAEVLSKVSTLRDIAFYDIGTVNLKFLEDMPWITDFQCGWANKVISIESIGSLVNLKSLALIDIEMDNLDFINTLPNDIEIELCGDEVHEGIEIEKLRKFNKLDMCEMTVGKEQFIFPKEEPHELKG